MSADTQQAKYELVISQVPKITKSSDRIAGELYADHKLFRGDHVIDTIRIKRAKIKSEAMASRGALNLKASILARIIGYLEEHHR